MAPSNDGKPSGAESRWSTRRSTRRSVRISAAATTDMDLDDEASMEAMGISDGFRPSSPGHASRLASGTTSRTAPQVQRVDVSEVTPLAQTAQVASQRPSSISKTNDFALRHDGGPGSISRACTSRQSSLSSQNPFIAPEERPYSGPSGPSFPYQMYPQNVRPDRTPSIATTSTAAPTAMTEMSYDGPRGPTHPYGMYPQNTVGDTLVDPPGPQPDPPPTLGFTGATDQYRRRAPCGEEEAADLIGPDGHTEELPPYTRYPDEAMARKVRDAQQPRGAAAIPLAPVMPILPLDSQPLEPIQPAQPCGQAVQQMEMVPQAAAVADRGAQPHPPPPLNIAVATSAAPSQIPGAGGMGLATRNPEFSASADRLGTPSSRLSSQSFVSQASSPHDIIEASAVTNVTKKPNSRWKDKAEKKLWGIIPYWAICMVCASLVVMGIILGAVIGVLVSKGNRSRRSRYSSKEEDNYSNGTQIPALDAIPIATPPAELRPLDEGGFSLPINTPDRSSRSCLTNSLQSDAWSCDIVYSEMLLTINNPESNPDANEYTANLSCNKSLSLFSEGIYSFGMQPPCFDQDIPLMLVQDIYESARGPAWFFQVPYEKRVILPERSLRIGDSGSEAAEKVKRFSGAGGTFPSSFGNKKSAANFGEKPWVCTWGGTILEVFIYVDQDSNNHNIYTSWILYGATATATNMATTTVASSGSSSTQTPTNLNPTAVETESPVTMPTNGQWSFDDFSTPPAPYPRVVKVLERRVNGTPSEIPTCKQYEISSGGALPVMDKSGNEMVLELDEVESEPSVVDKDSLISKRSRDKDHDKDDDDSGYGEYRGNMEKFDRTVNHGQRKARDEILVGQDVSDCGCVWWSM